MMKWMLDKTLLYVNHANKVVIIIIILVEIRIGVIRDHDTSM